MHIICIICLCIFSSIYADDSTILDSEYPWLRLPATPSLPRPRRGHYARINGVQIWYQVYGPKHAQPILFLHNGFGNSDYWGEQIKALRSKYRCIVMDSRGQGRSTISSANITYDLMASDAIKLLDHLNINKTHLVGWSDGAITGLTIAMNNPDRLRSLFAFAANYVPSGIKDLSQSEVFTAYLTRAEAEYNSMNPDKNHTNLQNNLYNMWTFIPVWNQQDFAKIPIDLPVWIVDGDRDEAIYRDQQDTMTSWIPQSGELILPRTSNFAFMQNPEFFTWSIKRFLLEARNSNG